MFQDRDHLTDELNRPQFVPVEDIRRAAEQGGGIPQRLARRSGQTRVSDAFKEVEAMTLGICAKVGAGQM
jgi:hypothetical protein